MVYALVSELGLIECMSKDINEIVEHRDYCNSIDIPTIILDRESDIEDALFDADGLNDSWFNIYNELLPCDAGIDIKIPVGIFKNYFDLLFDETCYRIDKEIKAEHPSLTEDELNDMVDDILCKELDCSYYVLDKIFHGEYKVI